MLDTSITPEQAAQAILSSVKELASEQVADSGLDWPGTRSTRAADKLKQEIVLALAKDLSARMDVDVHKLLLATFQADADCYAATGFSYDDAISSAEDFFRTFSDVADQLYEHCDERRAV